MYHKLRWDTMRHDETRWDTMRHGETRWDTAKTRRDTTRHVKTRRRHGETRDSNKPIHPGPFTKNCPPNSFSSTPRVLCVVLWASTWKSLGWRVYYIRTVCSNTLWYISYIPYFKLLFRNTRAHSSRPFLVLTSPLKRSIYIDIYAW